LAAHVEPTAISARREKHVIVAALDHLGEVHVELHGCAPALELARPEILEPSLRTLHAMERALRAVRERNDGGLERAGHREIAGDVDVAREVAGEGLTLSPTTPALAAEKP
jgi:hypothetical protein